MLVENYLHKTQPTQKTQATVKQLVENYLHKTQPTKNPSNSQAAH